MIKRLTLITLLLSFALPALAQSGGQFWVQAFEDRNGNGTRDAGEPFLTRGVSVDLLNADGVIMASGTLDDAPFANQGFIGFLYLAPGSYVAVITSPDLTPTTEQRVPVTITAGAAPVTIPYGAQRTAAAEPESTTTPISGETARLALAGFGALVVVGVMVTIGLLIYALVLRRRAPQPALQTTEHPRVSRATETGEVRRSGQIRRP